MKCGLRSLESSRSGDILLNKGVNDDLLREGVLQEQLLSEVVHIRRKRTDERHAGEVLVQVQVKLVRAKLLDLLHEMSDSSQKGLKRFMVLLGNVE